MTTLDPPDAELSGMKDNGKSQDNGSAAILILLEEISQKAKKKKKRKRKPKCMNHNKLNL